MKKNLFLFGFVLIATTMMAQTEKSESWYFKVGGSYFMQTAATEFPVVNGQAPNKDVYAANGTTLISRETITGSFGEGFRFGGNVGYRFTTRLGVEMGINYYNSKDKTMVETTNRLVAAGPIFVSGNAVGQISALDLAPALVLFLGEVKGFEPYSKVGVIVPVHGDLTIETNRTYTSPLGVTKTYAKDVVKPNPTVGFMAAVGTSYKLGKKLSAFAEVEYRNFTVHGKTKETTEFTVNGADALSTRTKSQIHTNYRERLDVNSNNPLFNPNTATVIDKKDTTRPNEAMDELSSYVGISGLGLTLGLKYSL